MTKVRVHIDPTVCIAIAFALMILPVEWVLSWLVAAGVHEASHYIALHLCDVEVFKIRLGSLGARMETECMPPYKEAICAAAGPLGGLLLILFYKWLPELAVCAAIQSMYNLLPLHPMDGGRILNALLTSRFGEGRGSVAMRWITGCTIFCAFVVAVYLWLGKSQGPLPLLVLFFLAVKSITKKS